MKYYEKNNYDKEFFATASWLRDELYKFVPKDAKTILDPCAGECGLEDFTKNYKYELWDIEKRCDKITYVGDFLAKKYEGERFDCVICNPPFAYTEAFINKAFEYSDDLIFICPMKSIMKKYASFIDDMYLNWKIPFFSFGVLTSIGIIHLTKNIHIGQSYNSLMAKYFMPIATHTFHDVSTYTSSHLLDAPFINSRITKGRIQRGELLISPNDCYEKLDDSVFLAECANANVKAGDRIYRNIVYFRNIDDMRKFADAVNKNADDIRRYSYERGNTLIRQIEIMLPRDAYSLAMPCAAVAK